MKVKVLIGLIDMNGYNGRENHPESTDRGKTGVLMACTIQEFDPEPRDDVDVFTVMLPDRRVVDLVEHEVEAIWMERESEDKVFTLAKAAAWSLHDAYRKAGSLTIEESARVIAAALREGQ